MKSMIMGTSPETLEVLGPRWPNTDIPTSQPLPAGSTVDTILVTNNRWNENDATQFLAQAGTVLNQAEQLGVELPGGVNYREALSSITAGAAIGTAIPGVGTIAGAAAGLIVYAVKFIQESGSGNGPYPNTQTAMWAQNFAEQAFVDWAVQNQTNTWNSIPDMARAQLLFWLERWGCVLVLYPETGPGAALRGASFYNGIPDIIYMGYAGGESMVRDLYKQAGVDYDATKQARIDANNAGYDITLQYRLKVNTGERTPGRTDQDPPRTDESSGSGALVVGGLVIAAVAALSSQSNNS